MVEMAHRRPSYRPNLVTSEGPFGKSGMSVSSDEKAAHGDVDHGG